MESKILSSLGKVAGLAGIALGVFLLIFRGVLEKQFLPQAGLTSGQAFAVILSLMILTFGIAAIGVITWLIGRTVGPRAPVPGPTLSILAALIALVLTAAVYVGVRATAGDERQPNVSAGSGGVAIGGNVSGTSINTGTRVPAERTEK